MTEASAHRHPTTSYEWSNAIHRSEGAKLPHRLHAVAWALADRAELKDGRFICWPSLSTLADDSGLSRRHVQRHLTDIEAAGWIVRLPGGPNRSTRYELVIPEVGTPTSLGTPATLGTLTSLPRDAGVTTVGTPMSPEVSIEVPSEVSSASARASVGADGKHLFPDGGLATRSLTKQADDLHLRLDVVCSLMRRWSTTTGERRKDWAPVVSVVLQGIDVALGGPTIGPYDLTEDRSLHSLYELIEDTYGPLPEPDHWRAWVAALTTDDHVAAKYLKERSA